MFYVNSQTTFSISLLAKLSDHLPYSVCIPAKKTKMQPVPKYVYVRQNTYQSVNTFKTAIRNASIYDKLNTHADVFVKEYQSLYTSLPTTSAEIDCVTNYVNGAMDDERLLEYKVHTCDIVNAVKSYIPARCTSHDRLYVRWVWGPGPIYNTLVLTH